MTEIALDCEWNRLGKLLCLAFVEYRDNEEINKFIIKGNDNLLKTQLLNWQRDKVTLIGHNIKSDLLTIYENTGILLDNPIFDTMIAFQQLTNGKLEKGKRIAATYGNVCKKLLGIDLDKSLQEFFLDKYDYEFSEAELSYILADITYLKPLKDKLEPILNDLGMIGTNKSFTIDCQAIAPVIEIEATGMLVDKEKWSKLIEDWKVKQIDLYAELCKELEKLNYPTKNKKIIQLKTKERIEESGINFNSHIQVKAIFKHFGITLPIDNDGKESTKKDLLATINIDNPGNVLHNFIEIFINYKIISKLIQGFGENIINNLKEGRIHTEYTLSFTSTGRLSSKANELKPYTINVQNIPARSEDGKHIMECIIAKEDYNIVCCDMSGE